MALFVPGSRDTPEPSVHSPQGESDLPTMHSLSSSESKDTGLQAQRRNKLQPETTIPTSTRDKQMVKGKHNNPTNRNHGHMATSEPSSPTTASPGYPNTPKKQELDLKSYLSKLIEGFKKNLNNSLKEIQETISQQVKALKEETQKSLKEIQKILGQHADALKEETQKYLMEIRRSLVNRQKPL